MGLYENLFRDGVFWLVWLLAVLPSSIHNAFKYKSFTCYGSHYNHLLYSFIVVRFITKGRNNSDSLDRQSIIKACYTITSEPPIFHLDEPKDITIKFTNITDKNGQTTLETIHR
jgi:hypothetical protein